MRKMPVLFVGHGSPMIALENNAFTKGFNEIVSTFPKPEHYLPMLYALALKQETDEIRFFNRGYLGGSLSMLSFKIGKYLQSWPLS